MKFISRYHVGTRWRIRLVNSLLSLNKNDYILDAGCGEGYISYFMSKKVKHVVGVDMSSKVIESNNRFSYEKLSFLNLDLNNLSSKFNPEFDKIVCLDVLEHTPNFDNIIHNFSGVLKRKGIFLTTIPIFPGHGHFEHDLDYIKEVLKKEDFDIENLEHIKMPFFTKFLNNTINYFRNLSGYRMKEVDSFDETLSFELRKKKTLLFKIYKVIFSFLFLITYFDCKIYRKGKDFILVKAVKK